ncbi:MAG: hypothetical protein WCW47_01145 [Candidatus Paceibacterota bacterium]|jgi:hypothetical protein
MANRDARQAVSKLRGVEASTFALLEETETENIVSVPELCEALNTPTVHLVGISCATGTEDGRDLNVASVGFFSRSVRQKTEGLIERLQNLGKEVTLTLFVQDLEWVRTWGWFQPQSELREEAWLQIEIAREEGKAPPGDILFWSDIEPKAVTAGCISYESALRWAGESKQSLALDADIRYRLSIPKFRYTRRAELEPSSRKRLADYALIGEALELLYPNAIFLQAADARTDHLLGLRRKKSLPIIHPWREREIPKS